MKPILTALGLAALLTVSACATATPYQPKAASGLSSGGYSDLKITSDRYRISFEGNSVTDRDTVERYLLYRAAEVTVREGADWFMLTNRRTDTDTRRVSSGPMMHGWAPEWEYLGRGRWALFPSYDRFWGADFDYNEYTRYRANAEILLGKGPKPANDPSVFDAREVAANLEKTIARPAPKP